MAKRRRKSSGITFATIAVFGIGIFLFMTMKKKTAATDFYDDIISSQIP